jgi:hypothetical protein
MNNMQGLPRRVLVIQSNGQNYFAKKTNKSCLKEPINPEVISSITTASQSSTEAKERDDGDKCDGDDADEPDLALRVYVVEDVEAGRREAHGSLFVCCEKRSHARRDQIRAAGYQAIACSEVRLQTNEAQRNSLANQRRAIPAICIVTLSNRDIHSATDVLLVAGHSAAKQPMKSVVTPL